MRSTKNKGCYLPLNTSPMTRPSLISRCKVPLSLTHSKLDQKQIIPETRNQPRELHKQNHLTISATWHIPNRWNKHTKQRISPKQKPPKGSRTLQDALKTLIYAPTPPTNPSKRRSSPKPSPRKTSVSSRRRSSLGTARQSPGPRSCSASLFPLSQGLERRYARCSVIGCRG
jgi:hypothetical protein